MTVRPAKTQISLGFRPVWSESSLCAQWVAKDPSVYHADRLIWVFAGRIVILLVLSWGGSFVSNTEDRDEYNDSIDLLYLKCAVFQINDHWANIKLELVFVKHYAPNICFCPNMAEFAVSQVHKNFGLCSNAGNLHIIPYKLTKFQAPNHTGQCLRRIAGGNVGLPLDTT